MNNLKLLANLIFTIVLISSIGCTKKRDLTIKELQISVPQKVKGMDPIFANDRYSSNEIARVYEGLLEYHYLKRPYTLVPNLAAEMPKVSTDGLTYTFKIRPGVFFHSDVAFPNAKGRELVAEDFVYSIKRLADPKLQSTGWWILDGKVKGLNEWRESNSGKDVVDYTQKVEGVSALDKYTLQFKLSREFPQFLYSLAMPFTFVVAKEVVNHYGEEFLNHPVGTGAFALKNFDQSNKITYTKSPTFRDKYYPSDASEDFKAMGYLADAGKKLPLVDKIVVNVIIENQPRWLNFQKGNLDYIGIPKDNFDSAVTPSNGISDELQKKGIELLITPSLDVTYTAFNHDNSLFQNVYLRRAMSLAYNVEKSNELFYNNTALPAQSIVPPGIAGHMGTYKNPYVGPNLNEAKVLLAKAGYPDGKGLPEITYDCPNSTVSRQTGEFFRKRMAEIGIKIRVIQNPWPELQKKITNRTVMMYGIAWGADYPDAENFLQLLYGPNKAPGANGSGYSNKEFDKLFAISSRMQDSPERTALYEKLNRMAAESVPIIYGVHRQTYLLKHSWVQNFVNTDFESGIEKYMNIDLEKKKKALSAL
jgi:oligopeptide transport system substrate-binding protein